MFAQLVRFRSHVAGVYALGVALVLAGLVIRWALWPLGDGFPYVMFAPAVVFSAIAGGVGPGFTCLLFSLIFGTYFFAVPTVAAHHGISVLRYMELYSIAGGIIVPLANAAGDTTAKLIKASTDLQAANETLEQRVAERTCDLMATEAQLRQAQKMEALGQLTGGIAHDFNNLLTSIGGSLERMETQLARGCPGEVGRYIDEAREATSRAAQLTQRLLAFGRRQPLAPRHIAADEFLTGVTSLISRSTGPNVRLVWEWTPGLWGVCVDVNQLEHALLNLCINAVSAMPAGGVLVAGAMNMTLDAFSAQALGLAPGDYVEFRVSDTGEGMPPEVRDRAFEPFFTTKPMGSGTGLGLSMVHGFVSQSQGQVRIDSVPGVGTTVRLWLSRSEAAPAAVPQLAAQPSVSPPQKDNAGIEVLVVDDERAVRQLVAEVLADAGYTVAQAEDAETALAQLSGAPPPALMVTDIGLPGMNGQDLAAAARRLFPALKILFITGYSQTSVSVEAPGTALLIKPFKLSVLPDMVSRMLAPV